MAAWMRRSGAPRLPRLLRAGLVAICFAGFGGPAGAADPLYEPQMEELVGIMGSLYFLQPLCGFDGIDWRQEASGLIGADEPDDDRRHRLNGAFNDGYAAYARLYERCTPSAKAATTRLMARAESLAEDIHRRYAR